MIAAQKRTPSGTTKGGLNAEVADSAALMEIEPTEIHTRRMAR